MDLLPEELLADILRRLPPRPLAVCRSVSKDLRAVIDGRGLLLSLAHRVPRGLRGIFINYVGQDHPYFFSRPADSAIDTELSFLPPIGWGEVVHHSNGLLLFKNWSSLYVCNPATQRWEQLPPPPNAGGGNAARAHLAFDPTVSLHYDVFFFAKVPPKPTIPIQPGIKRRAGYKNFPKYTSEEIKDLPSSLRDEYDHKARIKGSVEWPPSLYMAQVFSSRTSEWGKEPMFGETMSQLPYGMFGQTHGHQKVIKYCIIMGLGAMPCIGEEHSTSTVVVVSS